MDTNNTMSSAKDHAYALEGVYYASVILQAKTKELEDIIAELRKPNVMDGETGKDFVKQFESIVGVVESVKTKFKTFEEKAVEIANASGCHINNEVAGNFEAAAKAFTARAEDIKSKLSAKGN